MSKKSEMDSIRRKSKIVCTIGRKPESELKDYINQLINVGMDVARLNMSHYDSSLPSDQEYLKKLIYTIRDSAKNSGKTVAIMGDLQGPKVRIKDFIGAYKGNNKISVVKGNSFFLTSESDQLIDQSGATIKYEGHYNFFADIKQNVNRDDNNKPLPIEFWFADGKVILEAQLKDITNTSAKCDVIVEGELKQGQGISVKNSTIRPHEYQIMNYPKDEKDIDLLLQNDVDLFALSFVNNDTDVKNLETHIQTRATQLGLTNFLQSYCNISPFPIIAKIETVHGFLHLDRILKNSYGIMVARGDLALKTGIQTIGIYQKKIIDKCATEGKTVITATQMLLSMMDFKEPRRSEATDVTNAIFDGTDALMLSEETADPTSKFPIEAVQMMSDIAIQTENYLKQRYKLEYNYKIRQRQAKIIENQETRERELTLLEQMVKDQGIAYNDFYFNERADLQRKEIADHISYSACEKAFALKCKAIVVLTETGGTARKISRFKPDSQILAGVYTEKIARILKLSYGVESFVIKRKDEGYPFEEYKQVIEIAQERNLLNKGDRVIFVAGYPRREQGAVTFLNIYKI